MRILSSVLSALQDFLGAADCNSSGAGSRQLAGSLTELVLWSKTVSEPTSSCALGAARLCIACNASVASVVWPVGLRVIWLGDDFNQDLAGITFPNTVEEICFGEAFRRPLDNVRADHSIMADCRHDFSSSDSANGSMHRSVQRISHRHCFTWSSGKPSTNRCKMWFGLVSYEP